MHDGVWISVVVTLFEIFWPLTPHFLSVFGRTSYRGDIVVHRTSDFVIYNLQYLQ